MIDLTMVGNYTSHNPGGSGSRPSIIKRVIHPVRTIIKRSTTMHTNYKTSSQKPIVITSDSTLSFSRIPIGIVIS